MSSGAATKPTPDLMSLIVPIFGHIPSRAILFSRTAAAAMARSDCAVHSLVSASRQPLPSLLRPSTLQHPHAQHSQVGSRIRSPVSTWASGQSP